jgi:hypothetical protein
MKSATLRHDDSPIDSEITESSASSHQFMTDAQPKSQRKIKAQHDRLHVVPAPSLLNVGEVAKRIGVSDKTVRRWIGAKALPALLGRAATRAFLHQQPERSEKPHEL